MFSKNSNHIYTGTSGIVLPFKNKSFYPAEFQEKSRLEVYGLLNNSIEVNSSFYKIPMKSTVSKWSKMVPSAFKFTFKLFREITHTKGGFYKDADIVQFMDAVDGVDIEKRGCILMQFPASYKFQNQTMFMDLLQVIYPEIKRQKWELAIEFRDNSWYGETIYEMMDNLGFGLVIHDKGGNSTPLFHTTADFVYVRFHGPDGDYKGSYEDDFLHEYAAYIVDWFREGKNIFVYFNNTMGNALKNLETLRRGIVELVTP
ncbi:DUF72 domain-containing protein [Olivibacter sp. XZL3]|uniref:DUF72 domain-containing protein n=1 Tax=Olivibacter sp. XZL3 TaxID=1735116 RepID=UPI0010651108|nr:DUF72 domain-containing protein [Olivibacter sp. XZL3]